MAAVSALCLSLDATADAAYDALKSQVETLQRQLQEVQETLKQYEAQNAGGQDVEALRKEVAEISATQSEWKNAESVVHLAGYADVTYADGENKDGAFTGARFNPIFHYQYKGLVMLEAELEMEIGEDGQTETNLEYVEMDLSVNDYLALVGGRFLSPLGQFRQNIHPSWINKLPDAPPGFGHDQAAGIRDRSGEARGGFPVRDAAFANYAVYVGNGPILEIDDVAGEIEAVEAEGRTSNEDGRFVVGGRFGLLPVPMLEVGLSAATGKVAGEEETDVTRDYDVYGADFAWQHDKLGLRGEYIKTKVGAGMASAAPDSATREAWYAQASYRLLPTKWEGVLRYSDHDAHEDSDNQKQWAPGVNYLFSSNAMAKFAYDFNDGESGSDTDDDGFQLQFAYGFRGGDDMTSTTSVINRGHLMTAAAGLFLVAATAGAADGIAGDVHAGAISWSQNCSPATKCATPWSSATICGSPS